MTGPRRWIAVVALVVLAGLSVAVAPGSQAQVLPELPELPAPPADGNLLADVLGPASAMACKTIATAYALVGPIASAQLPPELQPLVAEIDPYLALITYACGYLVTPPTGTVCAVDGQVNDQIATLGLPVGLPAPALLLYETAAGIEHAFLRLGLDIGTDASRQLAELLGCGEPLPPETGPPAALPQPEVVPVDLPSSGSFGSGLGPSSVPAVVGGVAAPQVTELPGTAGQLGALSYPVRGAAALLLALPLTLLALGIAVAPRLRRPRRTQGPAPWIAP